LWQARESDLSASSLLLPIGTPRSDILELVGQPDEQLSADVWIYWNRRTNQPQLTNGYDTLLVVFRKDRVNEFRIVAEAPVRRFIAERDRWMSDDILNPVFGFRSSLTTPESGRASHTTAFHAGVDAQVTRPIEVVEWSSRPKRLRLPAWAPTTNWCSPQSGGLGGSPSSTTDSRPIEEIGPTFYVRRRALLGRSRTQPPCADEPVRLPAGLPGNFRWARFYILHAASVITSKNVPSPLVSVV